MLAIDQRLVAGIILERLLYGQRQALEVALQVAPDVLEIRLLPCDAFFDAGYLITHQARLECLDVVFLVSLI